jgi:hypothetical protein
VIYDCFVARSWTCPPGLHVSIHERPASRE